MPADQPRQPNRAWRQQTPAAVASAGKRAWQQGGASATTTKKPWSRGAKLAFSLGTLGVVFAGIVGLLYILKPIKPACLILIGADYAENLALPLNVYGWKSLSDLGECADRTGFIDSWWPGADARRMRLHHGPAGVEEHQTWRKIWDGLNKKVDEKTVIIYLALHGGSDSQGAYLTLNHPSGQERVSLKQIITDLGNSPELRDKNKLLVLDATQVPAHWPSGMLHNDFARKLRELKDDIDAQENLVVLCASDVNERSWVSEEWRRTIFGHYLVEGLKGAANSDSNSRVTALELANYVQTKVKAWVQANRNAAQTPFFLGGENLAIRMDRRRSGT